MPDNNDDPITMYVIVREELGMGVGKTCAQCCHAVQQVLLHYFKALAVGAKLHGLPQTETDHVSITTKWLTEGSRKVILKADGNEWATLKSEFKSAFVVSDAGLTQLEPGTETVMTFMPQHKSNVSQTIRRLSALR